MNPKRMGPATESVNGPRDIEHASALGPNTPNARTSQAPCPPDAFGESDDLFFIRRPSARRRLRLPFPSELPFEVWQPAAAAGLAAIVIVEMKREVTPWIRSRKFVFAAGGTA
jgi:hypothetical protein